MNERYTESDIDNMLTDLNRKLARGWIISKEPYDGIYNNTKFSLENKTLGINKEFTIRGNGKKSIYFSLKFLNEFLSFLLGFKEEEEGVESTDTMSLLLK